MEEGAMIHGMQVERARKRFFSRASGERLFGFS
jgi:hypothetical protein